MINKLVEKKKADPAVGGIVVQGYKMKTYKMDLRHPQEYRTIELLSVPVLETLQERLCVATQKNIYNSF